MNNLSKIQRTLSATILTTLFLLPLFGIGNLNAHDLHPRLITQAMGEKRVVDGKQAWILPIPTNLWVEINVGRKLGGKPRASFKDANSIPGLNLEYVMDGCYLIENELVEAMGTQPSDEQIFYTFRLGFDAMKKVGFKPDSIKDPDLALRWRLAQALKESFNRIPPPLPSHIHTRPSRFTRGDGGGDGR